MASSAIRELRVRSTTTFNTTFDDVSDASWAPGATDVLKLAATAYDGSGLVQASEPDPEIMQRLQAGNAPIATTSKGSFTFSLKLEGAESDTTANPLATLLSKIMGGIQAPASARTDVADSSGVHTTTRIYATGIDSNASIGQGILVGTRGDGKGNGEVRVVLATGTDYVDVNMAWSGAPADGDAIVLATTVYPDEDATQSYLDFLAIGHNVENQRHSIGGQATSVELANGNPGEISQFNFSIGVAAHELVPSGERDALTPATGPDVNSPTNDQGLGGLFLQDAGTTTRTVYNSANFAMPSWVSYAENMSANGINGVGGWTKQPSKPVASFDVEFDTDMPGLHDDLTNGTAKQLIRQFGHAAQKCMAIELQRCFVNADPAETDISGVPGVSVSVEGVELDSGATDLAKAAVRYHFF